MPSSSWTRRSLATTVLSGILVPLLLLSTACSAQFDPIGPCPPDGRAPGAYPELEALVQARFEGRPPDRLDSGRNCTAAALGTLASHGVEELRFGGGIWSTSNNGGVTFAVLEADRLQAGWVAEFYEVGARAGRNVEEVTTSREGNNSRIDVLNRESYQTVIVQHGEPGRISVVLVANNIREIQTREAHESVVVNAMIAFNPGVCCN